MSEPIAKTVRRAEGSGMIYATSLTAITWGILAVTGHNVDAGILVAPLGYGLWQRFGRA